MTTPDEHETLAAQALCVIASHTVRGYITDPTDYEAATIALLSRAIELIAKKELVLCFRSA
jgi:hypothetical protein